MPAPKQMPIVGTLTLKVQDLDREREGKLEGFNQGCRLNGTKKNGEWGSADGSEHAMHGRHDAGCKLSEPEDRVLCVM